MDEDKKIIGSSNSIYRMITDSLLNDISEFKQNDIDNSLNEKTFLNLFSIIRLIEGDSDKDNKQKDLNCLIFINKYGTNPKETDTGIANEEENYNNNREQGNINGTGCIKDNDNNKLIDTIWDEEFSIADNNTFMFDSESKIMKPFDFSLNNQSNILGEGLKPIGGNTGIEVNKCFGGGGGQCNVIEEVNENDDFLVFKKEDVIVNKHNKKNKDNEKGKGESIIQQQSTPKPIEVNHSSLSEPNEDNSNSISISNKNNNKSNDNTPNNNTNTSPNNNNNNKSSSNSNSNSNDISKSKSKSPIQSQSISKYEISIEDNTSNSTKNLNSLEQLSSSHHNHHSKLYNLSSKTTLFYKANMSKSYLHYMHVLYTDITSKSKTQISLSKNIDQLLFINHFKSFILSIGITEKNFYEDCVRQLVSQRSRFTFKAFLNCFKEILNYKHNESIIKFQFLLHIVKIGDEEYTKGDIKAFIDLIKCKMVSEDIVKVIDSKLIEKYIAYYKGYHLTYNVKKLALILETFIVS